MSVRVLASLRWITFVAIVGLLAGACESSTPSQPAIASQPASPSSAPSVPASGLPSASPSPTATPIPTPTPEPTPALGARPAHGPAGHPGGRPPPPDRGDGRRPTSSPAAVRLQLGIDRLARAGRGRHPALHDDLPGPVPPASGRSGARASTTSSGPPSGGRCMSTTVARPRRWRRSCAKGNGQWSTTPTASAGPVVPVRGSSNAAPHNVYTDGEHLGRARPTLGADGRADQADLAVRARRRRSAAAGRRHDHGRLPVRTDHATDYDALDEPLRAVHQRLEDPADRRRTTADRRAGERGHPAHGASARSTTAIPRSTGSRRRSSAVATPGSRRTA